MYETVKMTPYTHAGLIYKICFDQDKEIDLKLQNLQLSVKS